MKYQLFEKVVLLEDIAEKGLLRGDVATVVEHHPVSSGEDGYSLEVFNALGDTIAVITVSESATYPPGFAPARNQPTANHSGA